MNLQSLLEDASDTEGLAPGERRPRHDIVLRDTQAIKNRIHQLNTALYQSENLRDMFQRDHQLQQQMQALMNRIENRIRVLEKAQHRVNPGARKMFDILDKECSEFIPQMQAAQALLLRGINEDVDQFEGRSRQDRRPKDSSARITELFDQHLKDMGITALRSNSIYTTTSRDFASSYGWNIYVIFPRNGFDFLSTNRRDLILDSETQLADEQHLAEIYKRLDAWGLQNQPTWIHSWIHESVIRKDWMGIYHSIKHNFKYENNQLQIPPEYDLNLSDLITTYGIRRMFEPNTTDLVSPMKTGNEIMIHGEYWALKLSVWGTWLRKYYLGDVD